MAFSSELEKTIQGDGPRSDDVDHSDVFGWE